MSEFAKIAFIGTGNMGAPMAACLVRFGANLCLYDARQEVAAQVAGEIGAVSVDSLVEAFDGADGIITMLSNGDIVRGVLLGAAEIARDAVVIDMSSSYPPTTKATGQILAGRGAVLLDAPVSGGVKRAVDGSLAIMLGGDDMAAISRATPMLQAMGKVIPTGTLGTGHAMKALNNFVSAAGLAAACEAVLIGQKFGLDPAVMVDVLNTSTGRNNSTEVKFHQYILNHAFDSGFDMALMAKDLRSAADLAEEMRLHAPTLNQTAGLWHDADVALDLGADHTEIYRFLETSQTGRSGT